jgi:NlpC/P60 family
MPTASGGGGGKGNLTGDAFVQDASSYLGTPYVWGGESPKGFDCSGLVDYVLSQLGLRNVPRTSEAQYAWSDRVSAANVQAGDLVFLNFPGEQSPGHVMIYAGGKRVIQAPAPGQDVQVSTFDPKKPGSNEWGATVVGYGRVPGLSYAGEPAGPSAPRVTGVGGSPISSSPARPGTGSGSGGVTGALESAAGDAAAIATGGFSSLLDLISGPADFLKAALWLVSPVNWLRAVEVLFGFSLIVAALLLAAGADKALAAAGGSAGSALTAGASE